MCCGLRYLQRERPINAMLRCMACLQTLAAMSKRQLGAQLHEAVLTSLTALSRSASSITNRNVDSAVDYVFEQVILPPLAKARTQVHVKAALSSASQRNNLELAQTLYAHNHPACMGHLPVLSLLWYESCFHRIDKGDLVFLSYDCRLGSSSRIFKQCISVTIALFQVFGSNFVDKNLLDIDDFI